MLNWPGVRAALAPRLHPAAVLVDLHDARVVVAVGDEDVAGEIPRDVGRPIERAPPGTRRAATSAAGRRSGRRFFHRLGASPEHHEHFARGIELHDHVRAFVGRPDVAVLVDANRVREREAVEILADLAKERAVGPELEQLRRRLAVQRAARAGAAVTRTGVAARPSRRPRLRRSTRSAGSLRKSMVASKRISGTDCCANAADGEWRECERHDNKRSSTHGGPGYGRVWAART